MILFLSISALAILLIVGNLRIQRQSISESEYFLNAQKTKFWPLVATLVMTELNTSTLIAFSGLGILGIWSLWMPGLFLLGLGFYTLTVAKKWNQRGGLSVAELFTEKYGKAIGKFASFSLILAMSGFSSTYIKSSALFLSGLLPQVPMELSQFLVMILVLGFCFREGLVSIIRTDVFGFGLILLLFPILLFQSYIHWGDSPLLAWWNLSTLDASHVLPWEFIVSLLVLVMFTYIASPWYGQKIFSAESPEIAFRAVGLSSFLVFVLYSIPILLVGWYTQAHGKSPDLDSLFPHYLAEEVPPYLQVFAYSTLFLAGGTTLSGIWSAQAAMLRKDFYHENVSISKSRMFLLIFAVASWMGAVLSPETVLNQMILANIPIFALSIPLLAGFYWNHLSKWGALFSIAFGNVWGLGCFLYFGNEGLYTWYWTIYGLPGMILFAWLGNLYSKIRK